jgi:hypothetical protein
MLRCREVTRRASAYIDQELTFWPALEYRMHLLVCRHCRRFIHNFRGGIVMVRRLHRVPVEQGQIDAVSRRIQAQEESPP